MVLRELNNFHLLMAFISAYSNSAISRLKVSTHSVVGIDQRALFDNALVLCLQWTREKLSHKHVEQLELLEGVMSVNGSFKAYREAFAAATPPVLPYMGVHMQV